MQYQTGTSEPHELEYATDLSESGMFIRTRRPAEPGSALHVHFAPRRDAQLVQALCRVARVTPEGMAAEFLHLDAEAASLITGALS